MNLVIFVLWFLGVNLIRLVSRARVRFLKSSKGLPCVIDEKNVVFTVNRARRIKVSRGLIIRAQELREKSIGRS